MTTDAIPATPTTPEQSRDWRIWLGLGSTLIWLWLGLMYVNGVVGWADFVRQPADALGGFLEGAFAPLAFLWLVIGYFLQQRELRMSNRAIEVQARAIQANALHQEQETALLVADRVDQQLGSVTGLLWMSSQGPGTPVNSSEELISELWAQFGQGDPQIFARRCTAVYFRNRDDPAVVWDFFFGTPVRSRHTTTIQETVERLLRIVDRCDPDGVIHGALLGSGHGRLYQIIQGVKELGPPGER